MSSLTLLRGVPGSGKTTHALQMVRDRSDVLRVNRDDLRYSMFGAYWGVDEDAVTDAVHAMVDSGLAAGKQVIVDATNLNKRHVVPLLRKAAVHSVSVEYVDKPISLSRALHNDSVRESKGDRAVGRKVIEGFFKRYRIDPVTGILPPAPEPLDYGPTYTPDRRKPLAYSFDLDGTLALHTNRYGQTRSPYDTSKYMEDTPNRSLKKIIWSLYESGANIIILTGRDEEYRGVCSRWLSENDIPYDRIYMRTRGDRRPDDVIKTELFDRYIAPNYDHVAHWDDRPRVIGALRSKGITVYDVVGAREF